MKNTFSMMNSKSCIKWGRLFVFTFLACLPITGSTAPKQYECVSKYKDGSKPNPAELKKIIENHAEWLKSGAKETDTRRANLCNADLKEISLYEINLSKANLNGANLSWSSMNNVNLSFASMINTNFTMASLSKVNLNQANLTEAIMVDTSLDNTTLFSANLNKATIRESNLSKTPLIGANLSKAHLTDSNLNESSLSGANLHDAKLIRVSLFKANLVWANLSNANLNESTLTKANLTDANLTGTDLSRVQLNETILINTILINAKFTNVNLKEAIYEPSSSPDKAFLSGIQNLVTVHFDREKQSGLVLLRNSLKEAGLRELERQATYTIEKGKTDHAFSQIKRTISRNDLDLSEKGITHLTASMLKQLFRLIFFESTAGYGLYPGRCLIILIILFLVFALIYLKSIYRKKAPSQHGFMANLSLPSDALKQRSSGIYKIWHKERIRKDLGTDEPELINAGFIKCIGYALYFSLLSAFHIGWRDINVGNWIARIQPREYTLRSSGWVRTVSGIQSLISIYLLAFWILTQFGRPFD